MSIWSDRRFELPKCSDTVVLKKYRYIADVCFAAQYVSVDRLYKIVDKV